MGVTRQNLENRAATIGAELGRLAYKRREHVLAVEAIDGQVAAMEAQAALIEVTLSDLGTEEAERAEQSGPRNKESKEGGYAREDG